jgi:hypothetical protein
VRPAFCNGLMVARIGIAPPVRVAWLGEFASVSGATNFGSSLHTNAFTKDRPSDGRDPGVGAARHQSNE